MLTRLLSSTVTHVTRSPAAFLKSPSRLFSDTGIFCLKPFLVIWDFRFFPMASRSTSQDNMLTGVC